MSLSRRFGRLLGGSSAGEDHRAASHQKPGRTKGKMLRAKPPNVRGKGPLLDGPGFDGRVGPQA